MEYGALVAAAQMYSRMHICQFVFQFVPIIMYKRGKNARKFLFDFFKKEKYNTDKRVADQRKSSFAARFVYTCCRTL